MPLATVCNPKEILEATIGALDKIAKKLKAKRFEFFRIVIPL